MQIDRERLLWLKSGAMISASKILISGSSFFNCIRIFNLSTYVSSIESLFLSVKNLLKVF